MAEQKDPVCCSCRYGSHAFSDIGHGHVIDCVEWMNSRTGYRFAVIGAFELWMMERPNLGHNRDD
jgi:hypothetical protein